MFSGDFVVEEVFGESGERLRRLVFLSKPHLAQTEIQVQGTCMYFMYVYMYVQYVHAGHD